MGLHDSGPILPGDFFNNPPHPPRDFFHLLELQPVMKRDDEAGLLGLVGDWQPLLRTQTEHPEGFFPVDFAAGTRVGKLAALLQEAQNQVAVPVV